MAENDIYNSKGKYDRLKRTISELAKPRRKSKYVCQNPENLKYVEKLFLRFEARDISYVRRMRLLQTFKVILHNTRKDLKEFSRDDRV